MEEAVWRALSNPVRRRILDLLRNGPVATGRLAEEFPELSRFAVMQHIGVLEEASLVLGRRDGRRRLNFLNAVPIREVYERWVNQFAEEGASKAVALRKHLEANGKETVVGTAKAVRIENEIRVKAPIQRVWAAATTEQLEWYPHTYGRDRVKGLVFQERVGGQVYEDWGDDSGKLYGVIGYYDPPNAFSMLGTLGGGISIEQWTVLEADGEETVMKGTTVCFGEITDEMEEQIQIHGNLKNYEEQFKAYVEAS